MQEFHEVQLGKSTGSSTVIRNPAFGSLPTVLGTFSSEDRFPELGPPDTLTEEETERRDGTGRRDELPMFQ